MSQTLKLAVAAVLAVLVVATAALWLAQRRPGPSLSVEGVPQAVGRGKPKVTVSVKTPAGLTGKLEAVVIQGSSSKPLPVTPEAAPEWSHSFELDPAALELKEGPAELRVSVTDDAWRPAALPPVVQSVPFAVDLTPPTVEYVSSTTYVKHGGAGVVVFRATGAAQAGVQVGSETFPGTSGLSNDPALRVALYTVPYREAAVEPKIVATDEAGNLRTVAVSVVFLDSSFGTDEIKLTKEFLERKVPELDPQTPGDATLDELLRRFLEINGKGRAANEAANRAAALLASAAKPLWTGAFRQQSNSQVFAGFPQERTYFWDGKKVDQQWHLGIDLASNKHSAVEASNAGTVVSAASNGIYGNTVVIDHGLGLCSLYAHLSDMAVKPGDSVTQGQTVGHSGETGSAAGDHLHFAMLVHGVYTNPIEWFDSGWIHDRIGKPLAEAGLSLSGVTDLPAPDRPPVGKAPAKAKKAAGKPPRKRR